MDDDEGSGSSDGRNAAATAGGPQRLRWPGKFHNLWSSRPTSPPLAYRFMNAAKCFPNLGNHSGTIDLQALCSRTRARALAREIPQIGEYDIDVSAACLPANPFSPGKARDLALPILPPVQSARPEALALLRPRIDARLGRTAMDQIEIRPVYPIDDFCKAFGVRRSKAYAEIRAGRLKAFKVGPRTMVAGEDALAWRGRYRTVEEPETARGSDTRQPAAA